jgi:hypothetical protein
MCQKLNYNEINCLLSREGAEVLSREHPPLPALPALPACPSRKKGDPNATTKASPGTRHHEPWCAIGKSCDCDDDYRPRRRRPPPLSGGEAPSKQERELEEV